MVLFKQWEVLSTSGLVIGPRAQRRVCLKPPWFLEPREHWLAGEAGERWRKDRQHGNPGQLSCWIGLIFCFANEEMSERAK